MSQVEAWIYEGGGIGQPFCFLWDHQMYQLQMYQQQIVAYRETFGNKMAAPMVLHLQYLLSNTVEIVYNDIGYNDEPDITTEL